MPPSASAPGIWQSLRQLPGRTPLRVRLISAVLTFVAVALAIISIAGISYLRGYLLTQADSQLQSVELFASHQIQPYLFSHNPQSFYHVTVEWIPHGGQPQQVVIGARNYGNHAQEMPAPDVPTAAAWLAAHANQPMVVHAKSGGGRWLIAISPSQEVQTPNGDVTGVVLAGFDVTSIYATISRLEDVDLIVSGIALIGLAVIGVAVVRASLRPLTEIEATAKSIATGDLAQRVPVRDPRTEVGRLGQSLNSMLTQIESAFRARTESEAAARYSEEAAHRFEEMARRSEEAARKSEERLRQFVADASHELRTPLTAIRGYAEYYRQRGGLTGTVEPTAQARAAQARAAQAPVQATDGPGAPAEPVQPQSGQLTQPDLDRIIQRVEQEAARMGILVDDMLLLARLDQQRPLEFRTVDLLAIAADAVHDSQVIAPARTITLNVATRDAPLVPGDEVRLRQVVGNLMSNAMTHTPDGSPIEVTIRSGTLGQAPGRATGNGSAPLTGEPAGDGTRLTVILEVTDQGQGLTSDQAEHVFERFYRADRARTRTAGGTGLGLAIVAALVAAHHGRVWVSSEPGRGATFGFALPLAPEVISPAAEERA